MSEVEQNEYEIYLNIDYSKSNKQTYLFNNYTEKIIYIKSMVS